MPPRQPTDEPDADRSDEELVSASVQGDSAALVRLLRRQQTWIFNLAFYMLQSREDAEDATQGILVKIATSLTSYQGISSFRTWSKKIAVNHCLDCRRSRPEEVVTGFGCYGGYLDRAPDADGSFESMGSPEQALLVEEARISCVMGMLLCLDRSQRIVFLLGELLETKDAVAAEVLSIGREDFRQQLARAREQLSRFMRGRCGLLDPTNPCRCARKTRAFIKDGIVDPGRIVFARGHLQTTRDVAGPRAQRLNELLSETRRELYPLFESPDVAGRLSALLSGEGLRKTLNLN